MSSAAYDPHFYDTLERAATCLTQERVSWTVFGGAAMVLHGHYETKVTDIDIIVTNFAASMLKERFSWYNYADDRSPRFHSDYLLRPDFGLMPVEIMGGFRILGKAGWTIIKHGETVKIPVGSQVAHVPTKHRLVEIFRPCGRQKDVIRAEILRRT